MRKNNKGFTLIELLATVVILGILSALAIPQIVGLVSTNRNKMYINDAKKLISIAEYQMKINNSDIEKPDPGDCIVVSLVYLDSNDFSTPPNNGTYEKESSFVLIKNTGTSLEYSAMMVEKMKKGGYRGVELTTNSELLSQDATRHVKNFKLSEVVNVERDVTKDYVNKSFKDSTGTDSDYISDDGDISQVYNYPNLSDSSVQIEDKSIPKIVKANLLSNRDYNTLNATLTLRVDDNDTPRKNLKVYYSFEGFKRTNEHAYGDGNVFTLDFNFADYGYGYDGRELHLYVTVVDPDGNEDRKKLDYKIHMNYAPEIDLTKSSVTKGSSLVAGVTSFVDLSVVDDVDTLDNLSVCLKEDSLLSDTENRVCDDYKKYHDYFSDVNTMNYTFNNCNGGCKRDGSTHYLTIFVKDSLGAVSSEVFSYTFSVNTPPVFEDEIIVKSATEPFTSEGSKNVHVSFTVNDDVDIESDMSVTLSDGTNTKNYTYSPSGYDFTFSGNYNGQTKELTVTVKDSEGLTTSRIASYNLYSNIAPEITRLEVESDGVACRHSELCPTSEGGSKDVLISLNLVDDIDYADNYKDVKVCISNIESDCNSDSNYKSFSEYYKKEVKFSLKLSANPYDGLEHKIYAYAKDSYGDVSKKSFTYKLYENKKPVINSFSIVSDVESFTPDGSLNTKVNISALDDFDEDSNVSVSIIENDERRVDNAKLSTYNGKDVSYLVSGIYDGDTRTIQLEVKDSYGLVTTSSVLYEVYLNQEPSIEIDVNSDGDVCSNEVLCSEKNGGNYKVLYTVNASDDMDSPDELQICLSEDENCSDYHPYSDYINSSGAIEKNYTFHLDDPTKPFDGSSKKLYAFVRDSQGFENSYEVQYKLYNNQEPVIASSLEFENVSEMNGITYPTYANLPNIDVTLVAYDDLDTDLLASFCYKRDEELGDYCTDFDTYMGSMNLNNDNFFHIDSLDGQVFEIYAIIKDSYGLTTTSEVQEYEIYKQTPEPIIQNISVDFGELYYKDESGNVINNPSSEEISNYIAYQKMTIYFQVEDFLDTYKVCITTGNNATSCSPYLPTEYAGDGVTTQELEYELAGGVTDSNMPIVLFVKDSQGNEVNENIYSKCDEINTTLTKYKYVFDSTKQYTDEGNNPIVNNQEISIDRCSGKCYAYNPDSDEVRDIFGMYDLTITYYDRFSTNTDDDSCSLAQNLEFKARCDFYKCFEKNNNYNRRAIGLTEYPDSEPWTAVIDGVTYVSNSHYKMYLTSYNEYNEGITLQELTDKVPPQLVADGYYDYDSSSSDPYVRISDG